MKKAHEYLLEHAVLDAKCDKCKHSLQHMDGYFVPLSVAMLAIEQVISNKMEFDFYWHNRKHTIEKHLEYGEPIKDGTKVKHTKSGNIYDWGFWGQANYAVVYKVGERNMQDSYIIDADRLEIV